MKIDKIIFILSFLRPEIRTAVRVELLRGIRVRFSGLRLVPIHDFNRSLARGVVFVVQGNSKPVADIAQSLVRVAATKFGFLADDTIDFRRPRLPINDFLCRVARGIAGTTGN